MNSTSGPDSEPTLVARSVSSERTFDSGRYVVRRLLGVGGQKIVYLVHDSRLDRDCALSVIKADLVDMTDVRRLLHEARAMARIGAHPNIVAVFDCGDEHGQPFVVCEYVEGGDLRQELATAGGPLSIKRALAIAKDLCEALAVTHAHLIVHRDIKPANIWLRTDGSAKLGDFGTALAPDRPTLTLTGAVLGTASYMAPEQALGETIDARTDLYALGCLLYEMVTGSPPFRGDNPLTIISQHIHNTPKTPSALNARVPRALDDLILRLMAKDPRRRYQNAKTLRQALESVPVPRIPLEPLRLVGDIASSKAWRRPRRRTVVTILLLMALVGSGSGALLGIKLRPNGSGPATSATLSAFETRTATSVPGHQFLQTTVRYISGDGSHALAFDVARTKEEENVIGLRRPSLAAEGGLLYDLPTPAPPIFTAGYAFPIDIVWIDSGKRIIDVAANLAAEPDATVNDATPHHPPAGTRYAIEMNAGAAALLGLAPGTELAFEVPFLQTEIDYAGRELVHAGGKLMVQVACTKEEAGKVGLSRTPYLQADSGLLYDLPSGDSIGDWQTTRYTYPVDIVWMNDSKQVIGVRQNVPPDTTNISSPGPVTFAMETNAGAAETLGLRQGIVLQFDTPCSSLAVPTGTP